MEPRETEIETLTREVREECGCSVEIGERLGQAVFHIHTDEYGGWTIHSTYYRAAFGAQLGAPVEADHTRLHVPCAEAPTLLFRGSDAWAVKRWLPSGP